MPDGAQQSNAAIRLELLRQSGLTEKIRGYNQDADLSLIESAFGMAAEAHGAQLRDNGDPYITHPVAVAEILAGLRLDSHSIITGLLHDTIEDTPLTLERIEQRFGADIAGLVDGVTKLTRLELQSDRTKQAENFRKLVLAMSRDIRVLLVKLADRLHNMRTLHFVRSQERRQRIARETMEIYAPLAERIGMDAIKSELQTLAFAQMEPDAYDTIAARLKYLRGQGADTIAEIAHELRAACEASGVPVIEVTGREKSSYSIWEKMRRRNVAFEQLSDIMAFRLIVPSREACYGALGAVHSSFPVIAGRFKDYISTPKANGYASLHTGVTLREPHNQKIEVQIRTPDMAEIADRGVAAHWVYKTDGSGTASADGQRLPWVQDLLEILENSSAADEFFENTKLELYQDQVFCFTPKGRLIQLPRGATPIDFAYAVHSQIGDTCVGAKVNGRLVPLRHELQNGDQVEILTSRSGTPSPTWEKFVVTGKARARIRRYVHAQQREKYLADGRVALARAFRQEGVDGSEKVLEAALKTLKCASVEDIYVGVGDGHIGPRDVVHACYPELRQTARGPRLIPELPPRTARHTAPAQGRMPISGLVANMAVHYAGCCRPLPGDQIVGIVTTGKGVTIHTKGCQTLESFAATPERFIDVEWDPAERESAPHVGRVTVIAGNEPGAMASVVNAVTRQEGSVVSIKVASRQQDFAEILVDVEVRDVRHLTNIIAGLRAAPCVHEAERARA